MVFAFSSCEKDKDTDPQNQNNTGGGGTTAPRTPISMSITSIRLEKWPLIKSNGSAYDFSSGPDIYLSIGLDRSNAPSPRLSGTDVDVTNSEKPYFTFTNPIICTELSDPYVIAAYDQDSFDADDFISGLTVIPNGMADNGAYPNSYYLNVGDYAVTVYLTWNF